MVPRYRASIAKLCQLDEHHEKENWDTFYNDEAMNKKVFNLVANLPKLSANKRKREPEDSNPAPQASIDKRSKKDTYHPEVI